MKKLLLFVASILLVGATFKEQKKVQHVSTNKVEQDFHEDFDSTYYVYGCKYNTFKVNHKCNGKI